MSDVEKWLAKWRLRTVDDPPPVNDSEDYIYVCKMCGHFDDARREAHYADCPTLRTP